MNCVKIKIASVWRRLICRHKLIKAIRVQDFKKLQLGQTVGVNVHEICTKCGEVKRSRFIGVEQFPNYNWDDVATFISGPGSRIIFRQEDVVRALKKKGGQNVGL